MTIEIQLTNPRHIAGANAAFLATIPEDPEIPQPYVDVNEYVQTMFEKVANSWADKTGVDKIPVAAFIRRFTSAEFDAIIETCKTDENVAAILAKIDAVSNVRLGSPDMVQAMAYLVMVGLVTQERSDEITGYG